MSASIVLENPAPLQRRCTARLHVPDDARSLLDEHGLRWPLQRDGDAALVQLELGPLEARTLSPSPEAVAGAHWDCDATRLDNGRLRAEFAEDGAIQRLCLDGAFVALGPGFLRPHCADGRMLGDAEPELLETGPLRARLALRWPGHDLELYYELLADRAELAVSVQHCPAGCRLAHPLDYPDTLLRAATLGGAPRPAPIPDAAWISSCDASLGEGLALIAAEGPLPVSWSDAQLTVTAQPGLRYAIADGRSALNNARSALCAAAPAAEAGSSSATAPWHAAKNNALLATAWRQDATFHELALAECSGARGRSCFCLRQPEADSIVLLVDAGSARMQIGDDACWITHEAGSRMRLRWRRSDEPD